MPINKEETNLFNVDSTSFISPTPNSVECKLEDMNSNYKPVEKRVPTPHPKKWDLSSTNNKRLQLLPECRYPHGETAQTTVSTCIPISAAEHQKPYDKTKHHGSKTDVMGVLEKFFPLFDRYT